MARVPTKGDLTELKSLASPPRPVHWVLSAVLCMLGHPKREAEDFKIIKKVLGSVTLLKKMEDFEPKTMTPEKYAYVQSKLEGLDRDVVRNVSKAALSFHDWVKDTSDALPAEVKVKPTAAATPST